MLTITHLLNYCHFVSLEIEGEQHYLKHRMQTNLSLGLFVVKSFSDHLVLECGEVFLGPVHTETIFW